MKLIKFVIIVSLIVAIGWSLKDLLFKEPDYDTDVQSLEGQGDVGPSEQVQSFSISGFSESGTKSWQVEGKSADILANKIDLTDIDANSFSDQTNVNLKADEGVFDRTSNNILLKNNVRIVTDEGTKLNTETLNWNAKRERISTDDHVYIKRADMDADGKGASALPNLKKAQLDEDVTVVTKDPEAVITCDGPLEVNYEENVAYFNDNVKLIDKETTIDTDKATAYFNPKDRVLDKVLCIGNVKIVRGKDVTYADELTYLPGEGRVILTGRPKIIIQSAEDLIEQQKKEDESAKGKESD